MSYVGFNSVADIRARLALTEATTTIEYEVNQAGEQNIVLSRPVSSGILFLNGLMQSPAYYALSGGNLTVPSEMGCQPGDVISFTY